MAVDVDALIEEAHWRSGATGGSNPLTVMTDLSDPEMFDSMADALEEMREKRDWHRDQEAGLRDDISNLERERDLLKAVALRQVQYRKTQVARLTRERDEALAIIERAKDAAHTTPGLWDHIDSRDHFLAILGSVPTAALNAVKAEAIRGAADVMLDPTRGLPFDDDHDLATVAAWTQEYADDIEKGTDGV